MYICVCKKIENLFKALTLHVRVQRHHRKCNFLKLKRIHNKVKAEVGIGAVKMEMV